MKKLIAIVASLSILVSGSLMLAYANEPESETATNPPSIGRAHSGGAGITAEDATVGVLTDDADQPEDVAGAEVTEKGLGLSDKEAVENVVGDKVEFSSFDVSASDEEKAALAADPDAKLVVTVPTELSAGDDFAVVVNYGDGWVAVDPQYVSLNADGTLTLTLDGYGEVSVWVGSDVASSVAAPVVTSTSSSYTSSRGDVREIPAKAIRAQSAPSKATDYTVVGNVDYTVVSPQTGYADTWVIGQ